MKKIIYNDYMTVEKQSDLENIEEVHQMYFHIDIENNKVFVADNEFVTNYFKSGGSWSYSDSIQEAIEFLNKADQFSEPE